MRTGEIVEYDGEFWRQDEASDGFFDVMVSGRDDRSPWVTIPDRDRCFLCRQFIYHSEILHEATIQYHIQVNEMRDQVLNEIAAGMPTREYTDNQVAALIYD